MINLTNKQNKYKLTPEVPEDTNEIEYKIRYNDSVVFAGKSRYFGEFEIDLTDFVESFWVRGINSGTFVVEVMFDVELGRARTFDVPFDKELVELDINPYWNQGECANMNLVLNDSDFKFATDPYDEIIPAWTEIIPAWDEVTPAWDETIEHPEVNEINIKYDDYKVEGESDEWIDKYYMYEDTNGDLRCYKYYLGETPYTDSLLWNESENNWGYSDPYRLESYFGGRLHGVWRSNFGVIAETVEANSNGLVFRNYIRTGSYQQIFFKLYDAEGFAIDYSIDTHKIVQMYGNWYYIQNESNPEQRILPPRGVYRIGTLAATSNLVLISEPSYSSLAVGHVGSDRIFKYNRNSYCALIPYSESGDDYDGINIYEINPEGGLIYRKTLNASYKHFFNDDYGYLMCYNTFERKFYRVETDSYATITPGSVDFRPSDLFHIENDSWIYNNNVHFTSKGNPYIRYKFQTLFQTAWTEVVHHPEVIIHHDKQTINHPEQTIHHPGGIDYDISIPLRVKNGTLFGKTIDKLDKTTYMDKYGDVHNASSINHIELECYVDENWIRMYSNSDVTYGQLMMACQTSRNSTITGTANISGIMMSGLTELKCRVKDVEKVETYSRYNVTHKLPSMKITLEIYK